MPTPTKGEFGGELSEALRQLLRRYHDLIQLPLPRDYVGIRICAAKA